MTMTYSDDDIRTILTSVRSIAVVGASANQERPSYGVLRFLVDHGYDVCAVNPGLAGKEIYGAKVYATLADVPHHIDMVDVFRNSEAALDVTKEALALNPLPRVIWLQLGVSNDEAARLAEARSVQMVMNRCPKIEIARLGL
jgi:predicted CoA-binding protein